ncbi:MAG TPA: SemiSWEET family transporter [Candidatus Eisenbacteria bacterium]
MRKVLVLSLCLILLSGCGELIVRHPLRTLMARVSLKDAMGFVAGLGTTFAAVPDLVAMLKRRSSQGMNPRMAGITGAFQLVWIYYGLLIESRPVIAWNMVAVAINSLSVGAYVFFSRREKRRAAAVPA